jgi:hypothetical protein
VIGNNFTDPTPEEWLATTDDELRWTPDSTRSRSPSDGGEMILKWANTSVLLTTWSLPPVPDRVLGGNVSITIEVGVLVDPEDLVTS